MNNLYLFYSGRIYTFVSYHRSPVKKNSDKVRSSISHIQTVFIVIHAILYNYFPNKIKINKTLNFFLSLQIKINIVHWLALL